MSKFSEHQYSESKDNWSFQIIGVIIKPTLSLCKFFLSASKDNTTWKMSVFGVILVRIFPYSARMRENTGRNNSEYGHFLRSVMSKYLLFRLLKIGQ